MDNAELFEAELRLLTLNVVDAIKARVQKLAGTRAGLIVNARIAEVGHVAFIGKDGTIKIGAMSTNWTNLDKLNIYALLAILKDLK